MLNKIKNINTNLLILICFVIIVFLFIRVEMKYISLEKMDNVEDTDENTDLDRRAEIAVKKIYGQDINEIRALSRLAREINYSFLLKKGNLSYIGDLHVTGNLSVDKNLDVKGVSDTPNNCC